MSDFELIERYLADVLTAEEKKAFRARLLNDPIFNQEFQELKEIRLQVRKQAKSEALSFLTEVEQSISEDKTTKDQTVMKKVISIAASVVLIASLAYIGLLDRDLPSNSELYGQYFNSYNNLNGQVRGERSEELSLRESAMLAYDAGNYGAAVDMLATKVSEAPNATDYFYLGVSQMEIEEYDEAVVSFNTVINNFNAFKDQSKWYLALATLKTNDEDAYLGALANIIYNKSEYSVDAQSLLEQLGFDLDTELMDALVDGSVKKRPDEDSSPDGSQWDSTVGKRKMQWGIVRSLDGLEKYAFFTEEPLQDLFDGDRVLTVVIEKKLRGKQNSQNRGGYGRFKKELDGRVYVVDKY